MTQVDALFFLGLLFYFSHVVVTVIFRFVSKRRRRMRAEKFLDNMEGKVKILSWSSEGIPTVVLQIKKGKDEIIFIK